MVEADLMAWLLSGPDVAALSAGRIYWDQVPPGAAVWPYVLLSLVSGGADRDADGAVGLVSPLVQVDTLGPDGLAVRELRDAVRARLFELPGGAGALRLAVLENERSGVVRVAADRLVRVSDDFRIGYHKGG